MLGESSPPSPPIVVLGLGNPILRDDGVGWQVVAEAERRWQRCAARPGAAAVRFDTVALGGLALMEALVGCERAILVDATQTPGGLPGTVYRLGLGDLPTRHADAVHDACLADALELGRRLGAPLPGQIAIIAIEAADVCDFGETLTPTVAAAVSQAAELVLAELERLANVESRLPRI